MASRRAQGTLVILVLSFGVGITLHPFFENLPVSLMFFGWFIVAPLFYFLYPRYFDGQRELSTERPIGAGRESATRPLTEPTNTAERDDPLERIKHEYAAGNLAESEFERKLERLVELEDVEPETQDVLREGER